MARSDTLPTLAGPAVRGEDPAFAAQRLGQPGARRGLKEGAPALDRARIAYLATEWSGADDRRPAAGLVRRDAI